MTIAQEKNKPYFLLTAYAHKTCTRPTSAFPTADLDFASFKVDHSFENDVVLEVLLVPPASESVQPASFYIGLKRVGGNDGPWKVYYWAPSYRPAIPDPG